MQPAATTPAAVITLGSYTVRSVPEANRMTLLPLELHLRCGVTKTASAAPARPYRTSAPACLFRPAATSRRPPCWQRWDWTPGQSTPPRFYVKVHLICSASHFRGASTARTWSRVGAARPTAVHSLRGRSPGLGSAAMLQGGGAGRQADSPTPRPAPGHARGGYRFAAGPRTGGNAPARSGSPGCPRPRQLLWLISLGTGGCRWFAAFELIGDR